MKTRWSTLTVALLGVACAHHRPGTVITPEDEALQAPHELDAPVELHGTIVFADKGFYEILAPPPYGLIRTYVTRIRLDEPRGRVSSIAVWHISKPEDPRWTTIGLAVCFLESESMDALGQEGRSEIVILDARALCPCP